jgi:hypothetical protein
MNSVTDPQGASEFEKKGLSLIAEEVAHRAHRAL